MNRRFVVIGIQGAGKSTQGTLLSHQLHLPYLSTGHIFREMAKEKTAMGRYVKETLNAGLLIPDSRAIAIVEAYLKKSIYKKGYILDGFPRTLHQAKTFSHDLDKVIFIDLPEKEALWRIAGRGDSEREDETVAGVQKRMELFNSVTMPVIDYYRKQNKLISVDGTLSIEDINKEVLQQLGKELIGTRVSAWNRRHKTIIAFVGLPGCGKSEAADYIKEKDVPVIRFGKIINDYIDEQGLPQTEGVHKKVRVEFRQKYGIAAMAHLNKEKLAMLLKKNSIIVIEGMRSYEEKQFLQVEFPKVNIVTVCIWADYKTRQSRLRKRGYRSTLLGRPRDINEVLDTHMGPTIALCDYLVVNDGTREELHHKLENIYREIYFS